ncbi:hypothetical protein FISHEDRAFT_42993 [Fistulina hepatica ATCC 64428]|uniref:Peptidase M48 domain-containing protein n=1 Tax=Fistulina hepatica ATCC 64428 TaxID=1128425 RepID=A0A0D7ADM7_9AGAR|nr:hypothetical protein FISHEDRAFT_42993 [Fistulina hepatica ATCC 64428]
MLAAAVRRSLTRTCRRRTPGRTIPQDLVSPQISGCIHRYSIPPGPSISSQHRYFSSTPRRQSLPLIPMLAAVLKVCLTTKSHVVRTAGRVMLTFIPVLLFKNRRSRQLLKRAAISGVPTSEEKKNEILRRLRRRTQTFNVLMFTPLLLLWATIVASLEQTPLTGRWRLIVLSPAEEDEIAAQLAGQGWFKAIAEILSPSGAPIHVVSPSDWRYQWVESTLRQLESTIPLLLREKELPPTWVRSVDRPLPPPAEYPLQPRPRAAEYLRGFCERMCERSKSPTAHTIPGPPYSLVIVDEPASANAFSYGFGPDGAGGIVLYSGFLDEVLAARPNPPPPSPPPSRASWLVRLGLGAPQPQPPQQVCPTPEQATELAVLLSHELAHLVLAHHLETLSAATVIIPGALSIFADIARVLVFPVTMLFGPFVNDAVAQLGRVGSLELTKIGESCTTYHQEIEADQVSVRILAHAGYDARDAVTYWEQRILSDRPVVEGAHRVQLAHSPSESDASSSVMRFASTIMEKLEGDGHPPGLVRVSRLKEELLRWETERRAAARKLDDPPEGSSIVLMAA